MANTKKGSRPHKVSEKSLANLRVPTSEEAREYGKRGGQAVQEKYRKQKNIREMMQLLLSLPVSDTNKAKMQTMGIRDEGDQNNKMLVAVGLLQRAMTGDPKAIEVLCGIAGEEINNSETEINNVNQLEITFVDAGVEDETNSSN